MTKKEQEQLAKCIRDLLLEAENVSINDTPTLYKSAVKLGYIQGRLETMASYCEQNAADLFLKHYGK